MKISASRITTAVVAGTIVCAAFVLFAPGISRAQDDMEIEITARARLFPDIGPGIKAVRRDAAGRYYFLSTVDPFVRV